MISFSVVLAQAVRLALRGLLVSHFQFLPYNFNTNELPAKIYDFIVVGSGCGGSVVASRLSETSARVLLLEAGGSAPPESAAPGLFVAGLNYEFLYNIKPLPEKNAQFGFQNNSGQSPVGRVMGGSTTFNAMVYARGSRKDYDNWARLGNSGWDYDSVLPYFMKSENFSGRVLPGMGGHHHSGGPLNVESRKHFSRAAKAFLDGTRELGYRLVDGSIPEQIGFSPLFQTTRNGVRVSASEAFLRPVIDRPNLVIRPNATVTRVLFDNTKRAVGVEFVFNEKLHIVKARKEVILSAGALLTPQLLMLSGVGPRRHLQEMRIPVVAPVEGVGQNLKDHLIVPLNLKVQNYGGPRSPLDVLSISNIKTYIRTSEGYLEDSPSLEVNGWSYAGGEDPEWSDVQINLNQMALLKQGELAGSAIGMKPDVLRDGEQIAPKQETITITAFLSRPNSKGSVKLASTDPRDHPAVHFNYLDRPDDVKILIEGIRLCQKIIATRSMRDGIQATLTTELVKHCGHHGTNSDKYWECYFRHIAFTTWHYTSTSKMAPESDPMGVVSPRLRVRGVSGLRVVDASIMPQVISANTMAATYMIGEKGADMIKEEWGYRVDPLPVPNL